MEHVVISINIYLHCNTYLLTCMFLCRRRKNENILWGKILPLEFGDPYSPYSSGWKMDPHFDGSWCFCWSNSWGETRAPVKIMAMSLRTWLVDPETFVELQSNYYSYQKKTTTTKTIPVLWYVGFYENLSFCRALYHPSETKEDDIKTI